MRQAHERLELSDDRVVRNPILYEAHPDDLMAASDDLRQRTMALEPREPILGLWIATALMGIVGGLVFATFRYRDVLKAYFGLL